MSLEHNNIDLQVLLNHFTTYISRRFSTDTSRDDDSVVAYFYTLLPDKLIKETDLFLLISTLIPHFSPAFYDQLFDKLLGEGNFPELGGIRGKQHRGILPTGEMVLFLLSQSDLQLRQALYETYFCGQHWLFQENILYLEPPVLGEPRMSGKLVMADEFVTLFLTGKMGRPNFGVDFPAQLINTDQEWDDLVLHSYTKRQVQDLLFWLEYGQVLLNDWGLKSRVNPGYRVLFYGPSGTGKTLTATLLGKYTGRDVYRVDLSMVVSKYIGETEKNLSKLFDKAESKEWILFFDEADALFGKRSNVSNAHDRYANQEVSYLLQRVEVYQGLVILASNIKDNIDSAFLRRFQSVIHFSSPRPSERLRLWEKSWPDKVALPPDMQLKVIANQFELSGADIVNIVHFCCLRAISENQINITEQNLLLGIERELKKLGMK